MSPRYREPVAVPKLCGGDNEVGNFVLGVRSEGTTCNEAATDMLKHIRGLPRLSKRHAMDCPCHACRPNDLPPTPHWNGYGVVVPYTNAPAGGNSTDPGSNNPNSLFPCRNHYS